MIYIKSNTESRVFKKILKNTIFKENNIFSLHSFESL